MKQYYTLKPDADIPRPVVLDEAQRDILNFELDISFLEGKPLEQTPPAPLRFSGHLPDIRPPHMLEGDSIPVVSRSFMMALKEAGIDNFELFPAEVHSKKLKKTWADYFALNTIGVLDIVDLKKSKYDIIMKGNDFIPPFLGFHHLVFSSKKIKGDPSMFRILQNQTMLFINESVADRLIELSPQEKWGISMEEVTVI
jgi:hypothetical protein